MFNNNLRGYISTKFELSARVSPSVNTEHRAVSLQLRHLSFLCWRWIFEYCTWCTLLLILSIIHKSLDVCDSESGVIL